MALNNDVETEVKELMGLFDLPAFARRGQDLEVVLGRLRQRCRQTRGEMLDMVHVRLRQWSRAVTGHHDWPGVFTSSIESLWPLAGAEPPAWANTSAPIRRRRIIAADLNLAVRRFNRRWIQFLEQLNVEPANTLISQYNLYYVLEKECVIGSPRLAARHFAPVRELTAATLLEEHPALPVPELALTEHR
jgi:hypothetical protein